MKRKCKLPAVNSKSVLSTLSNIKLYTCHSPSTISNTRKRNCLTSVAEMTMVQFAIAKVKIDVFLIAIQFPQAKENSWCTATPSWRSRIRYENYLCAWFVEAKPHTRYGNLLYVASLFFPPLLFMIFYVLVNSVSGGRWISITLMLNCSSKSTNYKKYIPC